MGIKTCIVLSQVRAHQLVLPPCEVVIKAVSEYVSSIKDLGNLDAIARDVFKQSQVGHVYLCHWSILCAVKSYSKYKIYVSEFKRKLYLTACFWPNIPSCCWWLNRSGLLTQDLSQHLDFLSHQGWNIELHHALYINPCAEQACLASVHHGVELQQCFKCRLLI